MSDKPILFSAPMVRAILDGRKTVTRRILKAPKWSTGLLDFELGEDGVYAIAKDTGCLAKVPLRWAPGDRLWVREALIARPMANFLTGEPTDAIVAAYAADDEDVVEQAGFNVCPWWKGGPDKRRSLPSIHMPRWAARIFPDVVSVRVERLQDIAEADAIAEGISWDATHDGWTSNADIDGTVDYHGANPIRSYEKLWDRINGPGSWEANPWVAVVEFRRMADAE